MAPRFPGIPVEQDTQTEQRRARFPGIPVDTPSKGLQSGKKNSKIATPSDKPSTKTQFDLPDRSEIQRRRRESSAPRQVTLPKEGLSKRPRTLELPNSPQFQGIPVADQEIVPTGQRTDELGRQADVLPSPNALADEAAFMTDLKAGVLGTQKMAGKGLESLGYLKRSFSGERDADVLQGEMTRMLRERGLSGRAPRLTPDPIEWGRSIARDAEEKLAQPKYQLPEDLQNRDWKALLADPDTRWRYLSQAIGRNVPNTVAVLAASTLGGMFAGTAGAWTTAASGSFLLESGASFDEIEELTGDKEEAARVASTAGVVNAALEVAPIMRVLRRVPGLKGKLGGEVAKELASRPYVRRVISESLKQGAYEGVTEGMQEVVQNAAKRVYDGHQDLLDNIDESAFIGGVIGALFGGGVQAIQPTRRAPSRDPAQPETETPPGAARAEPSAPQFDGIPVQPTVPEPQSDIEGGIEAVRRGDKPAAYSQDPNQVPELDESLTTIPTDDGGVLVAKQDAAKRIDRLERQGRRFEALGYAAPKPEQPDGTVVNAIDKDGRIVSAQVVNRGTPEFQRAKRLAKRHAGPGGRVETANVVEALQQRQKATQVDQAASETDTQPTDGQKEAGNYQKGKVALHGLDISIENPRGSTREGVDKGGQRWKTTMKHHYGYIRRSEGRDGDQVDAFLGPEVANPELPVYVIDQVDPQTGKFDEHKVMLGFRTEKQARRGYLTNYQKGWQGLGRIRQMSLDEFKDWVRSDQPKKQRKVPRETFPESKQSTTAQRKSVDRSKSAPRNYIDSRLKRDIYRDLVVKKAHEDMAEGGDVAVVERDHAGRPLKRSSSVNPSWVQEMLASTGMSVKQVRKAAEKAARGEKLGSRQAAAVRTILDQIGQERVEQDQDIMRQRLAQAREARRAARAPKPVSLEDLQAQRAEIPPPAEEDVTAGQKYNESFYTPEITGTGRTLEELHEAARQVDEDRAIDIMQKAPTKAEAARQLFHLLGERDDGTDTGRGRDLRGRRNGEDQGLGTVQEGQAPGTPENRTAAGPARGDQARARPVTQEQEIKGRYSTYEISTPARGRPETAQSSQVRSDTGVSGVPGGQLDLFTPAAPEGKKQAQTPPRGKFTRQVDSVQTGVFRTGIEELKTPEDVAHLAAPLRKAAQENLVAVVTDAQNRPLSVIRHTIGKTDSAGVEPGILLGAVHAVPGANKVWMVHNHPSGREQQSGADHQIVGALRQNLENTGVDFQGSIVVSSTGRASFIDGLPQETSTGERTLRIPAARRRQDVPVTERRFKQMPRRDAPTLNSPEQAKAVLNDIAGEEEGVLLLDNSNRVAGWLPMSADEMMVLRTKRTGAGASRLYDAIHRSNANSVIIKINDAGDRAKAANVMNFAENNRMRALDIFAGDRSLTQLYGDLTGIEGVGEPFYSRKPSDPQDFIQPPRNFYTYGVIDDAIARTIKRQAAPIQLQLGNNEYGLTHIRKRGHEKSMRDLGFNSVEDFVAHVGNNYDEIRRSRAGRLLLVKRAGQGEKSAKILVVQLSPSSDGDFYSVTSAYVGRDKWIRKQGELLWERSETRSAGPGSQPTFALEPENEPGQTPPNAEGGTNNLTTNIRQRTGGRKVSSGGLSVTKLRDIVDPIVKKWKNAPPVLHVQSVDELPPHLNAVVALSQAESQAEGMYDPDTGAVWLIADNIRGTERAQRVLFHEALGHYGIRQLMGGRIEPLLRQVYRTYGKAGLQDIADRYHLDLDSPRDRLIAAEEKLAHIAETGENPGLVRKAISLIRQFLRKLGFNLKLSDSEIRQMMADAARSVREGSVSRAYVDGKLQPLMSQQGPIYYSQLKRVIADKLQNKGTPTQFKQTIQALAKKGQFKQEELEWTGLMEWLDDQSETVTRDQVIDFLNANQLEIKEIILQGRSSPGSEVRQFDRGSTKFDLYQLPGEKQSYRELLLTLSDDNARGEVRYEPSKDERFPWGVYINGSEYNRATSEQVARDEMHELMLRKTGSYIGPHFREPGVLLHARFNERTDTDGNHVLFIEEIQSDWHKKGRTSGYRDGTPLFKTEKRGDEYAVVNKKTGSMYGIDTFAYEKHAQELADRLNSKSPKENIADTRVPNAPFKTSWPMLAIKRMIRWAADNGFDKVAFTTGEQQIDRYDLSNHIDTISVVKIQDSDQYSVQAYKNKSQKISEKVSKGRLPDFIGKDLAKKVNDQPPTRETVSGSPVWEFSGLDLRIGGEGLRAFYDNILVNEINKYIKKWGGKIKAESINIPTARSTEWNAEGDLAEALKRAGLTDDQINEISINWNAGGRTKAMQVAPTALMQYEVSSLAKVHAFDVTEKMKEAAYKGQPLFSLSPNDPHNDPVLQGAMDKIGRQKPTLRERWKYLRAHIGDEFVQGALDRFYGIKLAEQALEHELPAERSGYVAARMSTSLPSQVHVALTRGPLQWDAELSTPGIKPNSKGLISILEPVADKLDMWSAYMVAKRAKRLMAEGREQLFSEKEIDRMLELGEQNPEFELVAREWAEFNHAMLDFAEEAGLIDPQARQMWAHSDYVPFYRLSEEGPLGPKGRRGLVGQTSGIKTLVGGTSNLNDIVENMLANTTHLIRSSVANVAAQKSVAIGKEAGLITDATAEFKPAAVPMSEVKKILEDAGMDPDNMPQEALEGIKRMWSLNAPSGKDVIRVMEEGKAKYYRVHDPLLLRALTQIRKESWGKAMEVFRAPKRLLTNMITLDPAFMARNYIRDTMSAFVIARDKMTPALAGARGLVAAWQNDEDLMKIWAAGGGFHAGYINAHDPHALQKEIRALMRKRGISPGSIIDSPRKLWDTWQDISSKFENANRIAVYQAAKRAGKSDLEAAFEAKDLMDFSMRGDWAVVQFLAESVPFWNARVQGLYRLARGARETPKSFAIRGSLLMLAGLALYLKYEDDERYKKLEDWDKNTYYHFWIGGEHFRIPKPFEVGALFGTIPERITEAILTTARKDGDKATEQLLKQLGWVFSETFNFGTIRPGGIPVPAPQTAVPMLELWANQDTFTERPILGMADQGLLPQAQYNAWTSATARELGEQMGMSPKQIEHFIRGYTGTLGGYALGASDLVVRRLWDYPQEPSKPLEQYPVVRSFWRGSGEPRYTRFQTEMYELLREADQTHRTLNKYRRERERDKAKVLLEDNRDKLRVRNLLQRYHRQASRINDRIKQIHDSRRLTPEEKRQRIDALIQRKNDLYEQAVKRAKPIIK